MTSSESMRFNRSSGTRFAPVAGLIVSAIVMTRGAGDSLLTLIGAVIALVSVFGIWWTWRVPIATFDGRLLIWREVPQRGERHVDLQGIRSWRAPRDLNIIEFDLGDGQTTTLNMNAMSTEDSRRLLSELRRTSPAKEERR